MSLINEALKKAQTQRSGGPPPSLHGGGDLDSPAAPYPPSQSDPKWPLLIGIVLAVGLVFGGGGAALVWVFMQPSEPSATVVQASSTPTASAPAAGEPERPSETGVLPTPEASTGAASQPASPASQQPGNALPEPQPSAAAEPASASAPSAPPAVPESAAPPPPAVRSPSDSTAITPVSPPAEPAPAASTTPSPAVPAATASPTPAPKPRPEPLVEPASPPPASEPVASATPPAQASRPEPATPVSVPSPSVPASVPGITINRAEPPKPEPAPDIVGYIRQLEIRAMVAGGRGALIFDPQQGRTQAYKVGDVVNADLRVAIKVMTPQYIIFVDHAGVTYSKRLP